MANATATTANHPSTTPSAVQIIRIEMPHKGPQAIPAPMPLVPPGKPFPTSVSPAATRSQLDSSKAHAAAKAKREAWAALNLRQEWADAAYMRGHLSMAGLRVTVSTEPATVNRIKAKLRSIGIHSPEIQEAVGMPLARWLKVNPGLPLWAALALVLESMGGFTPAVDGAA